MTVFADPPEALIVFSLEPLPMAWEKAIRLPSGDQVGLNSDFCVVSVRGFGLRAVLLHDVDVNGTNRCLAALERDALPVGGPLRGSVVVWCHRGAALTSLPSIFDRTMSPAAPSEGRVDDRLAVRADVRLEL